MMEIETRLVEQTPLAEKTMIDVIKRVLCPALATYRASFTEDSMERSNTGRLFLELYRLCEDPRDFDVITLRKENGVRRILLQTDSRLNSAGRRVWYEIQFDLFPEVIGADGIRERKIILETAKPHVTEFGGIRIRQYATGLQIEQIGEGEGDITGIRFDIDSGKIEDYHRPLSVISAQEFDNLYSILKRTYESIPSGFPTPQQ